MVIIWMGIIQGGGITRAEFDRWEFSARGVADSRLVFFIRHFVFLSVFILKTLAFHYKHKAIFGCSVSLVFSMIFYIFASKIKVSFSLW